MRSYKFIKKVAKENRVNFPNQEFKGAPWYMSTSERWGAGGKHKRAMVAGLSGSNYQALTVLRRRLQVIPATDRSAAKAAKTKITIQRAGRKSCTLARGPQKPVSLNPHYHEFYKLPLSPECCQEVAL